MGSTNYFIHDTSILDKNVEIGRGTKIWHFSHIQSGAIATLCSREYDLQVPYGVIESEEHLLKSIIEKPVHKFFVNAPFLGKIFITRLFNLLSY